MFCRWLSEKEGHLYGLNTEAQWENACRAGTTSRTYWGDNVDDRTKANVGGGDGSERHAHWAADGYEYTAPVDSFPPNPWGVFDMIGNAREWVADWYAPFTATGDRPCGPAHRRLSGEQERRLDGRFTASALLIGTVMRLMM